MKNYLLCAGLAVLCLFGSCSNSPKMPERKSCKAVVELVSKKLHDSGGDVYYNVTGFDTSNKDCFDYLLRWGEGASNKYAKPAITIHFLDDLPMFKPPASGDMYGDATVRERVILQYVTKIDGDSMVFFSPFGLEKYGYPPTSLSPSFSRNDTIDRVQALQKEIDYFEKEFDNSAFRGHPTKIEGETVAFAMWVGQVDAALKDSSAEVRKLGSSFEKKLSAFQVKEFPAMRKAFAEELRKLLWESDIDVTVQGKGFTTLNLTGALFAANKNIGETQGMIEKQLYNLRFKEVRYRWYDGSDKFTYYDLKPPKDSDLVQATEMRQ